RVDRLEHRAQRVCVGDVLLVGEVGGGTHPFDVGAGREARPFPRENDRADATDIDEGLCELGDDRGVERVAAVGPRQGNAEDVAVALGREVLSHGEELRVSAMMRGTVAAAVTPLRNEGLDSSAVGPYVDFLVGHGVDGVLALGTTGESMLFSPDERRAIAAAFVEAGR